MIVNGNFKFDRFDIKFVDKFEITLPLFVGIKLIKVNPAYSSLIGLVKYVRMYGLASDEAAALVMARRGMRLSERLPRSLTAYPFVKKGKHVWSAWNQLNKLIKSWDAIKCRHDYYSISVSNWESLVTPQCEPFG